MTKDNEAHAKPEVDNFITQLFTSWRSCVLLQIPTRAQLLSPRLQGPHVSSSQTTGGMLTVLMMLPKVWPMNGPSMACGTEKKKGNE